MGSLVVIHGVGVRSTAYEDTFRVVERKLRLARPNIGAVKCLWGDSYGAAPDIGFLDLAPSSRAGGGGPPQPGEKTTASRGSSCSSRGGCGAA
jgi:hypothetical protein